MKISLIVSLVTVFDSAADARLRIFPIAAILVFYLASVGEISLISWGIRRKYGRH
jgi:hypothetical protein|nr:hypothetical protein [Ferrimicrobium acidiphilum]